MQGMSSPANQDRGFQRTGNGLFVPICVRRPLDFANQNNTQTINTIGERIYVGDWRELALLVRVHDKTMANGSSITIEVLHELPSPEDPSLYFVGPIGQGNNVTQVLIDVNLPNVSPLPPGLTATPALGVGYATSFGAFVRVVATALGGNPASGTAPRANVSIALQLKGT